MSWTDDVWNSLRGSWRLLLRDTDGFDDFDLSVSGFWRSFAVIIAIAPLYLYADSIVNSIPSTEQPPSEPASTMGPAFIALVAQWLAWPLVMAVVAHFFGLAHHYARYITVYNWSSVLVTLMQVPAILLLSLGESASGLASMAFLAAYGVVFYYRWYIARTALETTTAFAWALVLGDLVLSIGITRLIS